MFSTIIIFIAILSVLVFVHELGHFTMARKFGVRVSEFGFGFPPRVWGVYKKNGKWNHIWGSKDIKAKDLPTVYSINLLPLGGFVNIKGENGPSEKEAQAGIVDKDNFIQLPIWQRSIILSAGVTMNLLLAAILISIGFMIGLPQVLNDEINPKATVSERHIQITEVLNDSPADVAGLKRGDIILNINEANFSNYEKLQEFVNEHTGEELNYNIKRGKEELIFSITPDILEETKKGGIGVAIAETGIVKYPWYLAIWQGFASTIFLLWAIVIAFYELIKNLIIGSGLSADIAGPVGIASITGEMANLGFVYLMQFTALLSINLAVVNFMPFPALDGGRVLFLIIEKLKGTPVKREIEAVLHYAGFALLMLLVVIVTFRDIAKF